MDGVAAREASDREQAAFALKASEKHDFRYSGNRQHRIKLWLMPRIGRA